MNAVRDFLNDSNRIEEKLAIPSEIITVSGFKIDTTVSTWITPPYCSNMDWIKYAKLGIFLRTCMAFAADLLNSRSEATANKFFVAFKTVWKCGGWSKISSHWLSNGDIDFATVIEIRKLLIDYCENLASVTTHFGIIRKWFYWCNGIGIPGFNSEMVDKLRGLNNSRRVPFVVGQQVSTGFVKTKATKYRSSYTDMDFARIQAAMLRLEGMLNAGEIILSNGNDFSSLSPNHRASILNNRRNIGISHLVLGWLVCLFGDRPKGISCLRENDFEFFDIDGVKYGTVRFSDEIKRGYGRLTKPLKRSPLPLNGELVRLVPKLIKENREFLEKNNIYVDCNLPIFIAKLARTTKSNRIRDTLEDRGASLFVSSSSMDQMLKRLFKVINVPKSDGGIIVPTFNSFRDSNHTRWARNMPLESIAAITGKKSIRSIQHYTKPGIRHLARLDSIIEYQNLASVLNSPVPVANIAPEARIPSPFPYFQDGKLRVGIEGGCGCHGSVCPMAFDGSADCYICNSFTPVVEGPHEWTLKILVDRKADMIARGLPKSEWTRYDRHISAVSSVIRMIDDLKKKDSGIS